MTRRVWISVLAGLILAAAVVFFAFQPSGKAPSEVLVLCGGSMRAAMEGVIEAYEAVSDDRILLTVGDSGELAAQISLTREGDVFVCHDPFMPWAAEQRLIHRWRTVALLRVVIAVPKGSEKGITKLDDLARPGLRIGIGDTNYSTSGVLVKEILRRAEFGDAIRKNVRLEAKGHQKRANDVTLGLLDAAIIWDAVAHQFRDKIDVYPIENTYVDAVTSATFGRSDLRRIKVTVGIIIDAKDNPRVERFWEYATTRGRKIFAEHGFSTGFTTAE